MGKERYINEVLPLRRKLGAYALRLLKDEDEAEDIVQEVCLKLWCIRDNLAQYHSIEALSLQITKHLSLNRLKELQRYGENYGNEATETDSPTPETLLTHKDDMSHMLHVIDTLPDMQQMVLKMRHIEGMEIDEIARLAGSSPEAIRMNLSRARKRVKDIFFKLQDYGSRK
ncbi:RNA polymerase sigma factor [Dysgonomonas sp. 25]|uniref:RNA polymerase sigma factor n=1 Tax=Dysgonomonas sp. 25 TaxID=2302933 RepID=UPI0013D5A2CF|nr:sigma-70 family RNA polymerase sigma factor [Dysgonomonas sp. 25]NDV69266.1 sigma-70 family RNA polymerase sigma factor [Dysgonomonas sp. 25]